MKACQICGGELPPRKRSLCGSKECAAERNRRSVRAAIAKHERETGTSWHERYREKRNAARRAYRWRELHPETAARFDAERRARIAGASVGEPFTREEVFERDGWVCGLCHEEIDRSLRWPDPGSASLDHVHPIAKGGEHSRENAQASHLGCNIKKSDRVA